MAEIKVVELQIKTSLEGANNGISKLKTGLKEATKESKALGETMQGSKQSEFINQLGDGVGKLNPAFGSAVKGANGLILKMWEMVANPVGAILAGIVVTAKFLYEAFQSSVAGGKELKTIFAGISAVGEQVKDAIFGLGRALINTATAAYKFITLDFAGAAEDMKKANNEATESYKQLGNAVDGTTFKIVKNLEKQQQANDKARKVQAVVQSETNKLLVQSREILTDETASIKDKKKALEDVTKAEIASSKEKTRIAAEDLKILKEKAKALGGESEKKMKGEIREATIALNEAETENAMTGIKLNKQKKMLGRQELSDAKEIADAKKEALKTQQENEKTALKEREEKAKLSFENEKLLVDEQLKNTKISIDEKRNIVLNDNKLSKADRQKYLIDLQNQEIAQEDAHNKAIVDLNKRYDDEKENRLADTALKKEELDYNRKVLEIENLAKTELEKQTLIEKLDAEHKARLTIAIATDAEKKASDDKAIADKKKAADDEEIENNKRKYQAMSLIAQNGQAFISALQDAGIAKGKAGQAAMRALALIQIGIDTAQAFSTAVPMAIKAGAEAAKIAGPAAPIAGPLATAASYLSSATMIASNIAKAKKLLGGGGGVSTPSMSSADGGSATVTTAPSFNVVGASSTNQLAQTIGNQQQQPIKAYVVSGDVSTAQGLDRNIIQSASIG
jgi:hypothetical protein